MERIDRKIELVKKGVIILTPILIVLGGSYLLYQHFFLEKKQLPTVSELMEVEPLATIPQQIAVSWKEGRDLSPEFVEKCALRYRNQVAQWPDRGDVYGLLGYCLYHQGNREEAKNAYIRSIIVNPDFFWTQYNLGFLYFGEGNYEEASKYFNQALRTKADKTVEYYFQSQQNYLPIIKTFAEEIPDMVEHLKDGHVNAHMFVAMTVFQLKNYPIEGDKTTIKLKKKIDQMKLMPF